METRFDADFQAALQLMQDQENRPFVAAVVDLLNDIYEDHRPDAGSVKCTARGCEDWQDPDFSADWPCGRWLNAHRVAVAWLLERAQGVDKSPGERQREAARARKQRQREREAGAGLASGSPVRSQGDSESDGKREANAMAPAKASATAGASPDLWTPEP